MRFPTIDQYIDALSEPGLCLKSLSGLTLPVKEDGEPAYSSGGFGVVFSALRSDGVPLALKCFTRKQWGRTEAYKRLCAQLPESEYLVKTQYLCDEILVAPYGSDLMVAYDVVVMEYVEGMTLSEKIYRAVKGCDTRTLRVLSHNFDVMAMWLLGVDFAHGDLKPDNIMVLEDLSLKLIDYDGIFVEDMVGEAQRECGSQTFQHPLRGQESLGKYIDDYSIALISLSLRAIADNYDIYNRYCGNPSSLLIDSREAMLGCSISLNYIEACGVVDSKLVAAIKSPTAMIKNLREIIAGGIVSNPYASSDMESELISYKCGNRYGYVDVDGNVVIEAQWDEVKEMKGGVSRVRMGRKWGLIDSSGAKLSRLLYDEIWDFTAEEGLALVVKDSKYGFIDRSGRVAISVKYDYAASFSEGFAVASLNGRFGYIDVMGRWKVPPQYDFCRPVRSGNARVELNGEISVIRF
ncbi:MAG: WG repeat-containing protein [Rikenellaceae bacterium]